MKGTVSGIFREIFAERPNLLNAASNDEVLREWEKRSGRRANKSVRANLCNVKCKLKRKGGLVMQVQHQPPSNGAPEETPVLLAIEIFLDMALDRARRTKDPALDDVIDEVRSARNKVIRLGN
jgi:hypothetical protein